MNACKFSNFCREFCSNTNKPLGNSQVSPGQASSRYQPPDILQTSLGHGGSSNPPSALLRVKFAFLHFYILNKYLMSQLDWPTLHREVTLRYFSPDKYYDSKVIYYFFSKVKIKILSSCEGST